MILSISFLVHTEMKNQLSKCQVQGVQLSQTTRANVNEKCVMRHARFPYHY